MRLKETLKEWLRQKGMLRTAYRIKNRIFPQKNHFQTLSPHLLLALNHCFRDADRRAILSDSDYLEFGVYQGFSFWFAEALADQLGIETMRFTGFDSFAGLPAILGRDSKGDFRLGQFASREEEVRRNLSLHGVHWERTELVRGYYDQTLTNGGRGQYGVRRPSICVFDCDLYESAKRALNFVKPVLGRETFFIFDDWNCFNGDPEKGERRAFYEFMAAAERDYTASPVARYGSNCQIFLLEEKTARAEEQDGPGINIGIIAALMAPAAWIHQMLFAGMELFAVIA